MTRTQEITRFLTASLTEFLNIPHSQRIEKYGSGVYKMYQRIVENTIQSFFDQGFVLNQLMADKETMRYLEKIEFKEKYQRLYEQFSDIKDSENPKLLLTNAIKYLNLVITQHVNNKDIDGLAGPDFEQARKWLIYLKEKIEPENNA